MLTKQDITNAYRLILGREPESEAVVESHLGKAQSLIELRERFIGSKEFLSFVDRKRKKGALRPLDWGPCEIETRAGSDELSKMLDHVAVVWQKYGRTEPHWSVLTNDLFKQTAFADNRKAFYSSGERVIRNLRASAARCGIDIAQYKRCFELGCGAGRITIWLAQLFREVTAADISSPHLDLAREAARSCERNNVNFFKLSRVDDLRSVESFDVFVSLITLQHNPPRIIEAILDEVFNRLNSGGIAYFQVPTYKLNYRFSVKEYIANFEKFDKMEMHPFPQHRLFRLLEQHCCIPLEVRETIISEKMISNTILAQRKDKANSKDAIASN